MSFYYKYVNKNNEKRKLKEKLKHKTIYESDNVLLSPSKNSDDSLNFEDSISNLKPSHYDKDDLYTKNVKVKSKMKELIKKEEENFKFPPWFDPNSTIMDLNSDKAKKIIDREKSNFGLSKILSHYLLEKNSRRILDIINISGRKKVESWFIKTIEIEKNGGLYKAGNRRRTPGGVFFHIRKLNLE